MERGISKPPWANIQWFSSVSRTIVTESPGPIEGDWEEQTHETIESLKEQIRPFDRTELWDLAKRITNPYELISTHSNRLKLPKSICCLTPLSRSFFKMVECLQILDFFTRHKQPKLKSLHICEGPGGFVEAFHYQAEQKQRIISASYAMTLRSTHAMIPGWRRATQFLQKHTNIQLLYGPNRTGDIYEPENQECCVEALGPGGAHLVTADGGFDFSDDFHAQEKNIFRLLVCSSIILLSCVAVEGDCVLKLFDCNSGATRDLIAILASCFSSWSLVKPVTSRPCNSEWYFIGKGAYRERKAAIQLLQTVRDGLALDPPTQYVRLLKENPIEETLNQIQHTRVESQMIALRRVLEFCHQSPKDNHISLWESQIEPSLHWCSTFRIPANCKPRIE
jgi:23S rRNA U2552 (ribose-2'-O)-methylase RlmE/FtsJ